LGVAVFAGNVRAVRQVVFPRRVRQGVLYTTVDRATTAIPGALHSPAAVEAAKKGRAAAGWHGDHAIQYKAKLGADGNPEKDANAASSERSHRLHRDGEAQGWAPNTTRRSRNGEWEYQAFTAAKQVKTANCQADRLL